MQEFCSQELQPKHAWLALKSAGESTEGSDAGTKSWWQLGSAVPHQPGSGEHLQWSGCIWGLGGGTWVRSGFAAPNAVLCTAASRPLGGGRDWGEGTVQSSNLWKRESSSSQYSQRPNSQLLSFLRPALTKNRHFHVFLSYASLWGGPVRFLVLPMLGFTFLLMWLLTHLGWVILWSRLVSWSCSPTPSTLHMMTGELPAGRSAALNLIRWGNRSYSSCQTPERNMHYMK